MRRPSDREVLLRAVLEATLDGFRQVTEGELLGSPVVVDDLCVPQRRELIVDQQCFDLSNDLVRDVFDRNLVFPGDDLASDVGH